MKSIYQKIDKPKFKWMAILVCFLGDLYMSLSSYLAIKDYESYNKLIENAIKQQVQLKDILSPEINLFIYESLVTAVSTLAVFIILFHLFVYYLFYKEKRSAEVYLTVVSWVAAMSLLLMVTSQFLSWFTPLNLVFIVGYLFVANGIGIFKVKSSAQ